MEKYNFIIEQIPLDDIITHDTNKYNSNNHWEENIRPIDYYEKISNGHTSKWIELFKSNYKIITLDNPSYIEWMKKANQICMQTGYFSELFSDELKQTTIDLERKYPNFFGGIGYFVRTENVSLKYGTNGIGPYYSFKSIIESIVSSIGGHSPIKPDIQVIQIYCIPWVKISDKDEYRVFVYGNKITAISQQNIYSKLYKGIGTEKLEAIVDFFYLKIKNKINWMDSYTYDFAFVNENITQPYFIEPNSFGKQYAAGSALFHWLLDEDILYGKNKSIYFRFTV